VGSEPLTSDFTLIDDPGFETHPAKRAFREAMKGRSYGLDAINDAWAWFRYGWDATGPGHRGATAKPRDGRSGPRHRQAVDRAGGIYCERCGTRLRWSKRWLYSHDKGATWTPGPDPCPGRPSGTEQGER